MAIEWKDRIVEHPRRYQLVPVAGQEGVYDFVAVTGEVTEVGTPVNAVNMNSIESDIYQNSQDIVTNVTNINSLMQVDPLNKLKYYNHLVNIPTYTDSVLFSFPKEKCSVIFGINPATSVGFLYNIVINGESVILMGIRTAASQNVDAFTITLNGNYQNISSGTINPMFKARVVDGVVTIAGYATAATNAFLAYAI